MVLVLRLVSDNSSSILRIGVDRIYGSNFKEALSLCFGWIACSCEHPSFRLLFLVHQNFKVGFKKINKSSTIIFSTTPSYILIKRGYKPILLI